MPKKRIARKKTTARSSGQKKAVKRPAKKKAAARRSAKTKAAHGTRTAASKSKKPTKPATRKVPVKKRSTPARPASLGRPRIPGTAELDQMFLKDYEARQVFAFLGVKTVKELEEHPPDEIIERLTGPMVRTVDRIRKALAVNNRYLAGDHKFAVQFCKQIR